MYTITFTEQEMMILQEAIGELKMRVAAPLVESINRQIIAAREKEEAEPTVGE